MPLSEEWLDLVYSRSLRESSITSWVLPFPNSWREDFKLLSPRESSPALFTTPEFSLDKDTSLSVNNLLPFPAIWLELALNNTLVSLPDPSTRLASSEEQRERSPRSPLPVVMMTNELYYKFTTHTWMLTSIKNSLILVLLYLLIHSFIF